MVPSGMVSEMNWALSHTWVAVGFGVLVAAAWVVGSGLAVGGMSVPSPGVLVAELPMVGSAANAVTVCATAVAAAPTSEPGGPADCRLQARIENTISKAGIT